MHSNAVYIAVMAAVSYAMPCMPLTLIRKPIKNRFIQSFLYYVPYVTLAVMTFPAIMEATQSPLARGPLLWLPASWLPGWGPDCSRWPSSAAAWSFCWSCSCYDTLKIKGLHLAASE